MNLKNKLWTSKQKINKASVGHSDLTFRGLLG